MPRLEPSEIHNKTFDFIIIGGGTAGCVLANRLSSDSRYSVLVLEAGHHTQQDLFNVQIPLFNGKLKNTTEDWQLKSTTQPKAHNRTIGVPQGKMLGGSSAINACLYHRCSPADYDRWNTPLWSYQQLQPYFKKAETFHDIYNPASDKHGRTGPLQVSMMDYNTPLAVPFRQACREYGLNDTLDISDQVSQIGVTSIQTTVYEGQRSSAGHCYLPLELEQSRPGLFLGLACTVSRLVLDEGLRVTAVAFEGRDGARFEAKVGREVILSAGAILSPYLLLNSGIGPAAELDEVGLACLVDLAGVGKNLQNHWRVPLVHETTRPDMSLHSLIFKNEKESLALAMEKKQSPLARSWPDAVAYMKIPNAPDNSSCKENTPQIELFAGGLALCRELAQLKNVDCATLMMVYVAPFSKGSITLDKNKQIVVDLALLSDERDLECIEKGLLECMKIAENENYKKTCIKRWILHPETSGGDLKDYIRNYVDTLHHYAGTCKMGNKDDKLAVVDDRLNVHGVSGLRVVDASIFPFVPAGQTCVPVIACAERASDIILEDNQ